MSPGYRLTWVTEHLAIGSAPMSEDDLDVISGQGVTCILNLCAEYCDLHFIEAEAGFETYHLPIADEHAPDPAELEKALEWIDECIFLGKKVLIHCRFGVGRTGTVLTAYLIRRGFSRRMAEKRLKRVKAGPGNFSQWWFLRGYGKRLGTLAIREPALERDTGVDLSDLFARYERLVETAEADLGLDGAAQRCGEHHERCCVADVELGLLEAVYLAHKCHLALAREERSLAVDRAARASRSGEGGARGALCPLSQYGQCILYDFRPLACRLFDLDPERHALALRELGPGLETLSRELQRQLSPDQPVCGDLRFRLSAVVSGAYVQVFFDALLNARTCAGPA